MTLDLSLDDLDRLLAALDSHVYWQLSDQHYRNDAAVLDRGSDEDERVVEIAACRALADRLVSLR